MVEMPARLEIQPEVKTSAASLPCRSASSASSSTIGVMCARNVAGAAGAGAMTPSRRRRGVEHLRVSRPCRDSRSSTRSSHRAALLNAARPPQREREARCVALEIGEDAIAFLVLQSLDRVREMRASIVDAMQSSDPPSTSRPCPLCQARAAQLSKAASSRARSNRRPVATTSGLRDVAARTASCEARPAPFNSKPTQCAFVRIEALDAIDFPKAAFSDHSRSRSIFGASHNAGGLALQARADCG